MKYSKIILAVLLMGFLVLVTSCNSTPTPESEYKITYNIDGGATQTIYGEPISVCYSIVADAVIPYTVIGFGTIGQGLYMDGEIAVGTYTFVYGESYETMNGIELNIDVDGIGRLYSAGEYAEDSSITINVTSVTNNVAEGTFTATVTPVYTDTELPQKEVRSGTFKVQKCGS